MNPELASVEGTCVPTVTVVPEDSAPAAVSYPPNMAAAQRVVVCFTTIPSRITLCKDMLTSLKEQVKKPDAIYLHAPRECKKEKGKPYDLTPIIEILNSLGVIVIRDIEDHGPITKLLPVLDIEKDEDTLIILVDDDTWYGPGCIKNLYEYRKYKVAGHSSRSSSMVQTMIRDLPHQTCRTEPVEVSFLETVSMSMYQRSVFPDTSAELLDWLDTLPSEARWVDDITIGAYLSREGISRWMVDCGPNVFWNHNWSAPNPLSQTGNLAWRNLYVFNSLFNLGYFQERVPDHLKSVIMPKRVRKAFKEKAALLAPPMFERLGRHKSTYFAKGKIERATREGGSADGLGVSGLGVGLGVTSSAPEADVDWTVVTIWIIVSILLVFVLAGGIAAYILTKKQTQPPST